MRMTIACKSCRKKKSKCVHEGVSPCHSCIVKGKQETCELLSTHEIRKNNSAKKGYNKVMPPTTEALIESSLRSAVQNYPELFFLSSMSPQELLKHLDPLVKQGICALSAPFIPESLSENQNDLLARLELNLLEKIDDSTTPDMVTVLQFSTLLLILNWQKGKTIKGYLLGGFAERSYIILRGQQSEDKTLMGKEMRVRTLWSYQLITLSLRKGSFEEYKSRLYQFPLPQDNSDMLFKQAPKICYLADLHLESTRNLFSLFIAVTEIWADCSSWIIQGGKHHFREAPWDSKSEWNRINCKLLLFEKCLGSRESLNKQNLDAFSALGQGSIYCYIHLAILTSRILIHRNYMPFIPLDSNGPKGPHEKFPELDPAPSCWWKDSARTVFRSSKEISLIYNECKKRNMYSYSTFAGFVALTAASTLYYVKCFPSFDPEFRNAEVYYSYCADFLNSYKVYWELGSYYDKFLKQTVNMFKAASNKKLSPSKIALFENMKNELVEIANVAAPINKSKRVQIDSLLEVADHSENIHEASFTHSVTTNDISRKAETWKNNNIKASIYSLVDWDNIWPIIDGNIESWEGPKGSSV